MSEVEKMLRDVDFLKGKNVPSNLVLVTIDDVVEIFHQLQPYTMKKLDEATEAL